MLEQVRYVDSSGSWHGRKIADTLELVKVFKNVPIAPRMNTNKTAMQHERLYLKGYQQSNYSNFYQLALPIYMPDDADQAEYVT